MPVESLLKKIRACDHCSAHLPHKPNPVIRAHQDARIIVIGQAPGTRVHKTGIPWNDPSGQLLRQWMEVDDETFYDVTKIALVPMGFCYPGKGTSGDLPPRTECAPLWHGKVFSKIKQAKITLLVGQYSQGYYLGERKSKTLAETVRNFRAHLPAYFTLPHPSPRNRLWLRKNAWFEKEVVPELSKHVRRALRT